VLADPGDPLSGGEALAVMFRQGRTLVIDAAMAYRFGDDRVLIPLEEVSAGLGLAITVDLAKRRADGYYLSEERTFHVDLERRVVESGGRTFVIDDGAVVVGDTDLFVSLAALNVWLRDMHFEFHPKDLFIEVASTPPLPIVQRRLRDLAHKLPSSTPGSKIQGLPEVTAEYSLIRSPVVDVDMTGSWSRSEGPWSSATLRGAQDVLFMGTQWFLSFDRRFRAQDARVTMSRKDPEGDLLGPLHLTEIEAGDIVQPRSSLATGGSKGLGLRFTNRVQDVSSGSTTELRGELPDGWEAELYLNGILTAFAQKPEGGQYVFNAPLYPGTNDFVIVLYGPQGQREERRKAVRLGGDQPAPGKVYFDGAFVAQDAKALPVERWLYGSETQVPGDARDRGVPAGEARVTYGLLPGLGLAAGGAASSLEGKRHGLAGLSLSASRWDTDLSLDLAFEDARHAAAAARLATQVLDTGIFLQHETFGDGYRTPINSVDTRTVRSRSDLRVNRRFSLLGTPISAALRMQRADYLGAAAEFQSDLDASALLGSAQLDSRLVGYATRRDAWIWVGLQGSLTAAARYRYGWLRAGAEYSVKPQWRATGFLLGADAALLDNRAKVRLTASRRLAAGTAVDLGIAWTLPRAEISANVGYNSQTRQVTVSVGLRFSVYWIDGGPLPHVDHRALASSSLARAQVFVDRDGDGVSSPGDEPLRGIRLRPGRPDEQTDDSGRTTLASFSESRGTDVLVEEESLPDPFLRSAVRGYRVTARPGAPVKLAFPVAWVSDVEGRVLVSETRRAPDGTVVATGSHGLGNVQLVVLNEQGREVRRVRSEFDGFFGIMALPSGRYRLAMDPDQATRFSLGDNGGREIVLRDDTGVLSGVELNLARADRH
jgi:hypothetical protein